MSRSATPAMRNEATRRWKPPKVTPFAELTIGTATRPSRGRLGTVANRCGRKRNVERTHPQPPDPQSETGTLATHSGKTCLKTSEKNAPHVVSWLIMLINQSFSFSIVAFNPWASQPAPATIWPRNCGGSARRKYRWPMESDKQFFRDIPWQLLVKALSADAADLANFLRTTRAKK